MRRVARYLFTACQVASLTLCVAVCVLWPLSYAAPGAIGYGGQLHGKEVSAMDGHFLFCSLRSADPTVVGQVMRSGVWFTPGVPLAYRLPGGTITAHFDAAGLNVNRFAYPRGAGADTIWYAHVPCWYVAILAAVLPALRLVQIPKARRLARLRAGRCPACGYDLRASPERCPECGTPAAPVL